MLVCHFVLSRVQLPDPNPQVPTLSENAHLRRLLLHWLQTGMLLSDLITKQSELTQQTVCKLVTVYAQWQGRYLPAIKIIRPRQQHYFAKPVASPLTVILILGETRMVLRLSSSVLLLIECLLLDSYHSYDKIFCIYLFHRLKFGSATNGITYELHSC